MIKAVMMQKRQCLLAVMMAGCVAPVVAQPALERSSPVTEEVLVTGGAENIRTLSGSASLIDSESLAEFDVTDINQVLGHVPGVYVRQEDGYGLRPNIGIRGATSERSQKITLMEDGILIAPAPYSAPAAYYIPNVNRMAALEVFKGPAAIEFGPHTVGGAVNLVTRAVPHNSEGLLELTLGETGFKKARIFYGDNLIQDNSSGFGYWVDALHYGADGFKELPNGEDTGFERNDINAKLQWKNASSSKYPQWLQLKIGFADEESNETYLGLTDEDFQQNPLQRYAASQLDNFVSEHTQVHALYGIELSQSVSLSVKTYVNQFERAWDKFDGFFPESLDTSADWVNRVGAALALTSPVNLALINGSVDSGDRLDETLDVTNNAREYGAHGIELVAEFQSHLGQWQSNTQVGLRFHHDYVDRDHHAKGYLMQGGVMIFDGDNNRPKKALNRAESDAVAGYVLNDMTQGPWRVRAGLRVESIEGEFEHLESNHLTKNSDSVVLPGVGVFYQWTPSLGILAGVNKGFSPSSPAYDESGDSSQSAEESVNYEYGVRYEQGALYWDVIGFFSDYSNLLGRCRVSDIGCTPGEEFSAGEVQIAGAEVSGGYSYSVSGWHFPLQWAYTYTESAFQNSFNSNFSQWNEVTAGDSLPYLPEHQGRIQVGVSKADWVLNVAVKSVSRMSEQPSREDVSEVAHTQGLTTIDLSAAYDWSVNTTVKLIIDNLTDVQKIVSRKPFGARSNAPRLVKASLSYTF